MLLLVCWCVCASVLLYFVLEVVVGGEEGGLQMGYGARLLVTLHPIDSSSLLACISVTASVLSRLLVVMRCSVDLVVMPHSATS